MISEDQGNVSNVETRDTSAVNVQLLHGVTTVEWATMLHYIATPEQDPPVHQDTKEINNQHITPSYTQVIQICIIQLSTQQIEQTWKMLLTRGVIDQRCY